MKRDEHEIKGKIVNRGNGLGIPSEQMIERRAREIAVIDGREDYEVTDTDRDQARRELQADDLPLSTAPESEEGVIDDETARDTAEAPQDDSGMTPLVGPSDEESVAEELVMEGLEEAHHDQMLESRREERANEDEDKDEALDR
jgi:hypothetical protein